VGDVPSQKVFVYAVLRLGDYNFAGLFRVMKIEV
jgi:hypothetical protein